MRPNTNPETGVSYGVIACNSLNQDLVHILFYGSQATNVSEGGAVAEAEAELRQQYRALLEEASIAAAETGADREVGFDSEAYEERWFEKREYRYGEEDFVERGLASGAVDFQIEEPTVTGTYEGVTYQIGWLGGAAILWVFRGPIVRSRSLTSPCIPGAIDLDSGFIYAACSYDDSVEARHAYQGYGIPADWLAKETT